MIRIGTPITITVPSNPGSWGTVGGAVGVAAGLALVALVAYEWRTQPNTTRVAPSHQP